MYRNMDGKGSGVIEELMVKVADLIVRNTKQKNSIIVIDVFSQNFTGHCK